MVAGGTTLNKYTWKRLTDGVAQNDEPEYTYPQRYRLYVNGVGVGDYTRNPKTGDCQIMFYQYGIMNAPYRIYGVSSQVVARDVLETFASTGRYPIQAPFDSPISGIQPPPQQDIPSIFRGVIDD